MYKLDLTNKLEFRKNVEKLFDVLINECFENDQDENWEEKILNVFDYKNWLKRYISQISHLNYGFEREILDKYLPRLIELSSLKNLKNWEAVCRTYVESYKLRELLLTIARRIISIDKTHSLELLSEVWESNKDFFFSAGVETINSYLELLSPLDPEKAKTIVLEGFIHQYKNYPQQIIYNLDKVLNYSNYFDEPDIYEISYKEYEKYNQALTKGLSQKQANYDWIKGFPLQQPFEYSTIYYLVQLFDFPEVEVRKLALSSLFELIIRDETALETVIEICLDENENIKEHLLSLLYSVTLLDYRLIINYRVKLYSLLEDGHFNISQSLKELLFYCIKNGAELPTSEVIRLNNINTKPNLYIPTLEEGITHSGRRFIPSEYQATTLYNLEVRNHKNDLTDKVYTRILNYDWTSESGMEEEGRTQRSHNLNSNSDKIEINGSYFQCVQKILNETLTKEIQEQSYENVDIETLKYLFRLYDPSDLLIQSAQKLYYINWLGENLTDDEFLEFTDISEHSTKFKDRDKNWITLYEDGHQRSTDDITSRRTKRTIYFKVISFFVKNSFLSKTNISEFKRAFKLTYSPPYLFVQNVYKHELLESLPDENFYPFDEIRPMVGFSQNAFRGQNELTIGTLLPDIIKELNLSTENDYSLNYKKNNERVIEFCNWQEGYDQDRRRQKPKSAGVLLNIKKEIIEDYLKKNNLSLCYYVALKRSTSMYKPEDETNWEKLDFIFL